MTCCQTMERVKAKAYQPAKPKPADMEGPALDVYWVPKIHYEAFLKEWDKEDSRPLGVAFYGTNEVIIREGYVPMAYRLDLDNSNTQYWSHRHYYERLWAMPGRAGDFIPIKDKAVELHLHECGHALKGWEHDTGHPVMDGSGDGKRVALGKRVPSKVDRDTLFSEYIDLYPSIRLIKWSPGLTKGEVQGDDPY